LYNAGASGSRGLPGITGPPGAKGSQGIPGKTPSLTLGATYTRWGKKSCGGNSSRIYEGDYFNCLKNFYK